MYNKFYCIESLQNNFTIITDSDALLADADLWQIFAQDLIYNHKPHRHGAFGAETCRRATELIIYKYIIDNFSFNNQSKTPGGQGIHYRYKSC